MCVCVCVLWLFFFCGFCLLFLEKVQLKWISVGRCCDRHIDRSDVFGEEWLRTRESGGERRKRSVIISRLTTNTGDASVVNWTAVARVRYKVGQKETAVRILFFGGGRKGGAEKGERREEVEVDCKHIFAWIPEGETCQSRRSCND